MEKTLEINTNFNITYCINCESMLLYKSEDVIIKNYGSYTSKLCFCPHCNNYICYETTEDSNLDINNDVRYYIY